VRWGVCGCLTAVASCGLAACQRQGSADAGTTLSSSKAPFSIHVSMPDGWSAESAPDGSFRAGPAGRWVLRIDRRAGAAGELPSPAELKEQFDQEIKPVKTSVKLERSSDSASIVVFAFTPSGANAAEQFVMLGAKRASNDLFLCATFPGRDLPEARDAARACEELSVQRANPSRRD